MNQRFPLKKTTQIVHEVYARGKCKLKIPLLTLLRPSCSCGSAWINSVEICFEFTGRKPVYAVTTVRDENLLVISLSHLNCYITKI